MAESAVAGTEDNTAAETVATTSPISGEKDAQTTENVAEHAASNGNDNQTADNDVESDTAVETTQRKANDEPNKDSVNTSLTAEDEAHFRMLREAAESPPRETTKSARLLSVIFVAKEVLPFVSKLILSHYFTRIWCLKQAKAFLTRLQVILLHRYFRICLHFCCSCPEVTLQ